METIEVVSCYRCGRDWPADLPGEHPEVPVEMSSAMHGAWLERCAYERGTGRKVESVWVWVGPCCMMNHSGPETDLVCGPVLRHSVFEPLGQRIEYLPNRYDRDMTFKRNDIL